ncbi:MAG: GntR family transcriptional regulator [Alicyclobacillus sp.]|nr:GntR family transcriptional regulator [Alicyclobacillus sp.]
MYRYLREQILSRQFEPGSRIVESKVAKDLRVSRSPVREAIRRLEQEGLVQMTDPGVITLFQPSRRDFEDLYQLRLAVEPMAAQLAASRIDGAGVQGLERVLRETDASILRGEIDAFIDNNTAFHDQICQACGNPRLQKVMNEVSALSRYYRVFIFKVYHRRVESVEEHWDIFRAIRDGQAELAWERMRQHLDRDLRFVLTIHDEAEEG